MGLPHTRQKLTAMRFRCGGGPSPGNGSGPPAEGLVAAAVPPPRLLLAPLPLLQAVLLLLLQLLLLLLLLRAPALVDMVASLPPMARSLVLVPVWDAACMGAHRPLLAPAWAAHAAHAGKRGAGSR
mmetsp:Transcript_20676/g.61726  ORF Transcript_20676/g.61726 Transcript_20676/m.61726 type:complete len:126 (+) Transcript_20676:837-1214(+)